MELTTHENALALTLEALRETLEVAQTAAVRAGVPQDVD